MTAKDVHVIPVGRRRASFYALGCIAAVASGYRSVVLKARGARIADAVNVSQLVTRLAPHIQVSKVEIGTERRSRGDRVVDVSTMEITLESKRDVGTKEAKKPAKNK